MSVVSLSVRDELARASSVLQSAGCESPRLDAELLMAHALGGDRGDLVLHGAEALSAPVAERFESFVARRAQRAPVALIIGRRGFRHIELTVTPDVLIPRPETETLVEAALGIPERARVLDVGTGSGAVALALADERPDLDVHASDVSAAALEVASENAARLGLAVTFHHADLLESLGDDWDAIVSNPPYVSERDRALLAPEIGFEPCEALFAGEDGLDVIRRLVPAAGATRAAMLAVEVGFGQSGTVEEMMRTAGFSQVLAHPDLAGIPRVVSGRG